MVRRFLSPPIAGAVCGVMVVGIAWMLVASNVRLAWSGSSSSHPKIALYGIIKGIDQSKRAVLVEIVSPYSRSESAPFVIRTDRTTLFLNPPAILRPSSIGTKKLGLEELPLGSTAVIVVERKPGLLHATSISIGEVDDV